MKARIVSLITLVLACFVAVPAHAQEQTVTIDFRLTVNAACPNATYFANYPLVPSDQIALTQLSDPDGDSIYTATVQAFADRPLLVQLIQGTGVQERPLNGGVGTFTAPGDPSRVIRDFGTQTLTQNTVFEGSVSNCVAGLPPTGARDTAPTVALVGGVLLLVAGVYASRRVRQFAQQ